MVLQCLPVESHEKHCALVMIVAHVKLSHTPYTMDLTLSWILIFWIFRGRTSYTILLIILILFGMYLEKTLIILAYLEFSSPAFPVKDLLKTLSGGLGFKVMFLKNLCPDSTPDTACAFSRLPLHFHSLFLNSSQDWVRGTLCGNSGDSDMVRSWLPSWVVSCSSHASFSCVGRSGLTSLSFVWSDCLGSVSWV